MPMESSQVSARPAKRRLSWLGWVFFATIVYSGFSTGAAFYFYRQYADIKANPQAVIDKQTAQLVAEVGKLMVLPDEKPTIATVTEPSQLKGQAFFEKAKVGDKVLIYSGARKAILYDPTAKRIVEVGPLNTDAGSAAPASP